MRVILICAAVSLVLGCSKPNDKATKDNKTAKPTKPAFNVDPCTADDCVVAINGSVQKRPAMQITMQSIRLVRRHRHFPVGAMALDHLISRSLLLTDADTHKLSMTSTEATKLVNAGNLVLIGLLLEGKRVYYSGAGFDEAAFGRFIKRVGAPSTQAFMMEQELEQLAYKARERRMKSAKITDKDMRDYYTKFHTTATFDFVKYATHTFLQKAYPDAKQIAAYLAKHADKVRGYYDNNKHRFTGLSKQVRARYLFIGRRKAGSVGNADPGYSVAKAVHAKLAGGAAFAELAKANSEDLLSKSRGGDIGWRSRKHLGYGVQLVKAVAALELKKLSPVIATPKGFHIVRFDAERSGDLTYEQARDEIAAKLAHRPLATSKAQRVADAVLAKLKSGTDVATLFNVAAPHGVPKLTPEMIAKLRANKKMDPAILKKLMDAQKASAKQLKDSSGALLPMRTTMGPVRKDKFIPGLPGGGRAVEYVFKTAPLGEWKTVELGGDIYLLRVTKRTEPDWEKFKTETVALNKFLVQRDGIKALDGWLMKACKLAFAEKRVRINKAYQQTTTDKGKLVKYVPCQTLKPDRH